MFSFSSPLELSSFKMINWMLDESFGAKTFSKQLSFAFALKESNMEKVLFHWFDLFYLGEANIWLTLDDFCKIKTWFSKIIIAVDIARSWKI